jgi:transcriptional regulator with XRE-family HTH domain
MNYKKLKELVEKENLSQNKAATAFGMSAPGYKDMIENQTMKVETLEKIATHFQIPVSYFFDEQENILNEPKSQYKTNCCALCAAKDKQIFYLEKLVAMHECKKEKHLLHSNLCDKNSQID